MHLGRKFAERGDILAPRVDLEQFGADGLAPGLLAQGLAQDLLGLSLTAVGDVDLGLGDRIDLGGLDIHAGLRAGGAERGAGVDARPAGGSEKRVG